MNKNKNNKKKNLLFGQGLALHELRNLLVEASMRVRRDRFHSFRSSSTTKKKNTVSQIKDPSESKPQKFPPSKKKRNKPQISRGLHLLLLLLLPSSSSSRNFQREKSTPQSERDRGALLFLCLSERFVWLSFFLEIFWFLEFGGF